MTPEIRTERRVKIGTSCASSSVTGELWLVEGAVAWHGKQPIAALAGQGDECLMGRVLGGALGVQ